MNIKVNCLRLPCLVNYDQQVRNIEFLKDLFNIQILYYIGKAFKIDLLNKNLLLYSTNDIEMDGLIEHIYFFKLLL